MKYIGLSIVLLLVILTPALSQYSITGNLTGGVGGLSLKIAISFDIVGGTFAPALSTYGSYTISDLAAGNYIVAGFQDVNWNFFPDAGEPFGYYDGNQVVIVTVPPSHSGIDIELEIQPDERFSGNVTYSGTLTGATILSAFSDPTFSGNPVKIDIVRDTTGSGTGSYEFRIDPGTYYLRAHMDRNGDVEPNIGEPYGYYGSPNTPQPIVVTTSSWPSNIDVHMEEIPLLPVDLIIQRQDSTGITLTWEPIPFVQVYNIYRDTTPNIIPGGIPHASVTDTNWVDQNVLVTGDRYFYIVTSTDE